MFFVGCLKEQGLDEIIPTSPENEILRSIILERDAINNCVQVSHDNHVAHIGRLEDVMFFLFFFVFFLGVNTNHNSVI